MIRLLDWIKDWGRWTGLHNYEDPTGEFHRGKTVWDLAQLLVIPAALLLIGYLIEENRDARDRDLASQRATAEAGITQDRAQQAALEAYLDRMTDLLMTHGLRTSTEDSEVRDVARAQTLAALRALDGERRGMLVRFLIDSGLTSGPRPVVSLFGANLREADLRGANLSQASLGKADLSRADLMDADLVGTELNSADLSDAILTGANLQGAHLYGAQIKRASLYGADLSGADLSGAYFAESRFAAAKFFGANLNGTNFWAADLSEANLSETDLSQAYFFNADLRSADFLGVTMTQDQLDKTMTYTGAKNLPTSLSPDTRPSPTPTPEW